MSELRAGAGVDRVRLCLDQLRVVRRSRIPVGLLFVAADFVSILAIPLAGSVARQADENLQRNLCFWILLSLFTLILFSSHGGYRSAQLDIVRKQIGLLLKCFLMTSIAMLLISILLGHSHIIFRRWTLADLIITPLLICFIRTALTNKLKAQQYLEAIVGPLIVCHDRYPADLSRALDERNLPSTISAVLYLPADLSKPGEGARITWNAPLGRSDEIRSAKISDVVFIHNPELDMLETSSLRQLLSEVLTYPVNIWLAVDLAKDLPEMLKERSGSCQLIPIASEDLVSSANATKRLFDLLGSSALLLIFMPLLIVISAFVKASGPGPIIFRQVRTGAHGARFTVFKFRTMIYDPDRPFEQARRGDPRVTRIGKFLRRTSLDELLQLINVIRGEMSLVGPRPHAPETEVEGVTFENAVKMYRLRYRVKPGMTGLAQIRGQRGETRAVRALEQRLASDLEYIQSWSIWLDIFIMMRTLPVIVTQTNAS